MFLPRHPMILLRYILREPTVRAMPDAVPETVPGPAPDRAPWSGCLGPCAASLCATKCCPEKSYLTRVHQCYIVVLAGNTNTTGAS